MRAFEILDLLRRPPIRLYYMATGFWVSQTLFAAVDLGVFTLLDAQPLSAEEFCHAVRIELRPAQALLSSLVSLGLVRNQARRYSNSSLASRWLVKGKPDYLGDGLGMLQERLYEPWGRLGRALRTNRPTSFDSSLGELFDHLEERTEEQAKFIGGLHAVSLLPARALARRFNFSRFRHLADLGGGSGVYAIEVARRFAQLRATVVDRPQVTKLAQEYIKTSGMEDRVRTEARDIFRDPLPEGSDLALLAQVAHDFSPEENAALFRHLFEQLPQQGVLLLIEWLLSEDHTGPLAAALMSLNMLVDTRGGRSYSFSELRELLRAAGFRAVRQRPLYSDAQLVIVQKR